MTSKPGALPPKTMAFAVIGGAMLGLALGLLFYGVLEGASAALVTGAGLLALGLALSAVGVRRILDAVRSARAGDDGPPAPGQ